MAALVSSHLWNAVRPTCRLRGSVSENSRVFSPKSSICSIGVFSLFSPSILGCFTIFWKHPNVKLLLLLLLFVRDFFCSSFRGTEKLRKILVMDLVWLDSTWISTWIATWSINYSNWKVHGTVATYWFIYGFSTTNLLFWYLLHLSLKIMDDEIPHPSIIQTHPLSDATQHHCWT